VKPSLRIVLAVLIGIPLLLMAGIVLVALADSSFGSSAAGPDSPGYMVFRPDRVPSGGLPAVLLIHEWWGLNDEHVEKARRLADEGYVVYAPDAYGGRLAATVPGALFLTFTQDAGDISARIDAAWEAMLADPDTDADRAAVAGFCFGGRQAMMLGIRDSRPAATVTFYGSGLVTDPQAMGYLGENGPVLGIFGSEDASIPWTRCGPSARRWPAAAPAIRVRYIPT
jgi:carboxymethylenebutenolidase